MKKAEWLLVENQWGEIAIEKIQRKFYGGTVTSIFPLDLLEESDIAKLGSHIADETLHHMHCFDHRHLRFIFHPWLGKFLQHGYWKDPSWTNFKSLKTGISREIHNEREVIFGKNLIDIEGKSTSQLLFDEVLHPFYIFQVFSIILWCMDEYYYYAICIFIISATSVTTTLIETKRTIKKLREMSRFECDVRVFRGGFWRVVSSEELAPGDVFEISDPNLHIFPCDALLLTGDCIVNESMLTGESIPVSKLPITDTALRKLDFSSPNFSPDDLKYILFSGTKIVRVRRARNGNGSNGAFNNSSSNIDASAEDEGTALAMAVRTGFNTTKGALIRSILFPKPNKFKFYRDSFRFIGVLGGISFIGFCISTYNFIRMGVTAHMIVVRALDLITIVVPPALPATMSVGTNFAIGRLNKEGIYCISPARVNIGGKINLMCFDKTGTLTEDGLDVLGVRSVNHQTHRFSELHTTTETLSSSSPNSVEPTTSHNHQKNQKSTIKEHQQILFAMTTCHSLKLVNGELIGDPLDLKMFQFTNWVLEEGGQTTSSRSSVVLRSSSSDNSSTSSLNTTLGGTSGIVPTVVRPPGGRQFNLADVLGNDDKDRDEKATPFLELGILRTFEFVSSLRRMSVIVKRLRSHTMEVFVKGAPEVMKEICREETLPDDYKELLHFYTHHGYRVIACAARSFENLNWMKAQKIKREQVEQDLDFLGFIIFENKLKPSSAPVIDVLRGAKIRQVMCTDNVLTAVSVSRECGIVSKNAQIYIPRFIEGSSITPRATLAWENLDNSQDLLDPRTLEPILAPSLQENSVARAEYPPNDRSDFNLAITGDVFRWMVDYGNQVTLLRMLIRGSVFARMSPDEKHELVEKFQELEYCVGFCGDGANDCGALKAADVGLSLSEAEASVAAPFTSRSTDIQLGRTEPYPRIYPKSPTASLVSKKVLTSLIGQILIQSGFQFFVFFLVRRQPWYTPPKFDPDSKNIYCFEDTVLFLVSCFQYILIAAVFSVGPPYRKSMETNFPFLLTATVLTLLTIFLVIYPPGFALNILELHGDITLSFRWLLLIIAAADFFISWICEKYIFLSITHVFGSIRDAGFFSREKKMYHAYKKLYKRVEAEMGVR
ncbi:12192_t:CDS:10 [Ambispora gerdemannii]|uniref:Cation-transporting ATPase n=1 Tax=Ambispora gerdemannii TaxID=144530 RepID=A0A9N8ZQM5_9GLOM|nr:12192_t:CDS:10 [Ambispora gerdemannii]